MARADPAPRPAAGQEPLRPTTTGEQNLQSAGAREAVALQTLGEREAHILSSEGRRKINLIWETTQAAIALVVVVTTCIAIFIGRVLHESDTAMPAEWWTICGLVIGFYFGRTNHTKTGGVGDGPRGE